MCINSTCVNQYTCKSPNMTGIQIDHKPLTNCWQDWCSASIFSLPHFLNILEHKTVPKSHLKLYRCKNFDIFWLPLWSWDDFSKRPFEWSTSLGDITSSNWVGYSCSIIHMCVIYALRRAYWQCFREIWTPVLLVIFESQRSRCHRLHFVMLSNISTQHFHFLRVNFMSHLFTTENLNQ